jgi:DNA polymerase III subunit epsilon
VTPERYEELVRSLRHALSSPGGLLEALEARMCRLADAERFEEAASVRDRLHALVDALVRARSERWLVDTGYLVVQADGRRIAFRGGALERRRDEEGFGFPLPLNATDEVRVAIAWLTRTKPRLVDVQGAPLEPLDGGAALHRLRRRLAEAASRP